MTNKQVAQANKLDSFLIENTSTFEEVLLGDSGFYIITEAGNVLLPEDLQEEFKKQVSEQSKTAHDELIDSRGNY